MFFYKYHKFRFSPKYSLFTENYPHFLGLPHAMGKLPIGVIYCARVLFLISWYPTFT